MPGLYAGSMMLVRPDRQLIVKATFDRYNKRITFSSARNCTYDLLRSKIEQSFSLQHFSFCVAYKDDDGEVTDITNEDDLTEAIQYFQAGDDPPVSSAQSILSGRSFGSRKITLRVSVRVDYDGPSLSDTSSLASLEEYKNRNSSGSVLSLSVGSAMQSEPEDDSVTVSSRDMIGRPNTRTIMHGLRDMSNFDVQSISELASQPHSGTIDTTRFPDNPSSVFERLKLTNSAESLERNTQWLREQSSRTLNGLMATESVSDGSSLSLEGFESQSPLDGDLALQQDNGKFYYTYTSGSSSASAANDAFSMADDESYDIVDHLPPKLSWNASRSTMKQNNRVSRIKSTSYPSTSSSGRHSMSTTSSEFFPIPSDFDVPPEVMQFVQEHPQPPAKCTDCSACGIRLDSFRYVCSTCGEKTPKYHSHGFINGKGKARDEGAVDPFSDTFSYPPVAHRTHNTDKPRPNRPLPSLPAGTSGQSVLSNGSSRSSGSGSGSGSGSSMTLAGVASVETGYELCPSCFQTGAIAHALEVSSAAEAEPSSPEDELSSRSQRHRKAPQKGQFRHAYQEKVWSVDGWKDVEQDDVRECTICSVALRSHRYKYKCASCEKFVLCRACYSQVHEIHPLHAFLDLPEQPVQTDSESDEELGSTLVDESAEDGSLIHPDVKCAHCLMEIVGARFHCAICDSVDICQNCEAAGLPGNLNADDGGHVSSHIMIKIPIPLNSAKVQTASRRARQLWTGRDAENVRRSFIIDADARTVIGSSSQKSSRSVNGDTKSDPLDHSMKCNNCRSNIVGIRYQCASCPATRTQTYSLCSGCEQISYRVHNPLHVFFKINRPVDRPIESQFPLLPELYKEPAGPPINNRPAAAAENPKEYLAELVHNAALCDHCMEHIQGEWFRCAYCSKDLCDGCESMNAHEPTHIFYVFKAPVDMPLFRIVADLDNPAGSPPVLKYPVYSS